MKVLIIEDQPTELKLANDVLHAAGHTVNHAVSADQALASIVADRPDVILLDMSLPGVDGLALLKKLKSNPATRNIHVVALTSYPEKYSQADSLAAGCAAYLLKPISTRTLPQKLSEVVAKS